jgi:ABC-type multidrug transport system fused ATPase/permease subunit
MGVSTAKKLWRLMTASQRREGIVLLILMFVGMALETLGVGLVVPALALMTHGDMATRYPPFARWLAMLGNPSRERLVVGGMITLVTVYTAKAAFLSFLAWRQLRFVYRLQAQISQRLFAGYLRQPYTFHIQRNSAQLIRNALGEVHILTQNGVMEMLTFLAETLVVLGIFALLVYVEPVGALLSVGALALAGWGFYQITRNAMLRWGEARQQHEGMRIQHLQQGLGAVKDVKLLGREMEFIARYRAHSDAFARIGQRQNTLQQLPRLAIELLAVSALAALVITMIGQNRPLDALLPTIGVFAAAAFRIMPSANRIMNAVQITRHALPVVNTLYEEMTVLDASAAVVRGTKLPFDRVLSLDEVQFRYPGTDTPALRGISLTIEAGTSVGFIGGSGAGKSTLVDVILGLLTPQHGAIRVDDVDIQTNPRGWQDNIGYVPQHIYLTDDTLRRNIAFGLPDEQIDELAVQRALRAAQLEQFVAELSMGLDTMVGERGVRLSGGQLQRMGIARALYHDPPVLVLDEATSALDTATERSVMEAVRALHGTKTVIIVAHRLTTIEHCDRLYRLEVGRIAETGGPSGIIATAAPAPRPDQRVDSKR